MKAKFEKHKWPENLALVVVPKANPEIWGIMDHNRESCRSETAANATNTAEISVCIDASVPCVCGEPKFRNKKAPVGHHRHHRTDTQDCP